MNRVLAAFVAFLLAFPLIMFLNQALFYGSCFDAYCLEAATGKVFLFSLMVSGVTYALTGKPNTSNDITTTEYAPTNNISTLNRHLDNDVDDYRQWRDLNRQQSYGGWIYVFNIPDRNLFKIGMTAHEPWERMIEYCERYSLKPKPESLRKYKVPEHMQTGLIEEHIHSFIRLKGYQRPREFNAMEVFSHPGDYPTVVGHVSRAFEQAIE